MGQEILWCRCGSELWGRSFFGIDVGQIYGAGAVLGQMWVRSMWQEMLWGRCGSDLWGRSCCGADVGQILGAEAAEGHQALTRGALSPDGVG